MPLRDHFHSPLDAFTSWEGFYGQWPAVIVQKLGTKLPANYVAEPRVHIASQLEIDIAPFNSEGSDSYISDTSTTGGNLATVVWAPAKPTLAVETEAPDSAEYEVRVYDLKRGAVWSRRSKSSALQTKIARATSSVCCQMCCAPETASLSALLI